MNDIKYLYELYLKHPFVTTDSRNIKPGDLFFALQGPSFNGNAYAEKALDAGASYAIVDEAAYASKPEILLVENVLETLQDLAKHHREQLNIPVLGITGSNGKTTTKELIHAVLSQSFKTYTTEGNLNNHIGIPLTLLRIKKDAEIAVVEMGANHLKEIESYCRYALPNLGLITNCGKAHLEGFGSLEGVRKGKGELFDYLKAHGGGCFICDDFDYFHNMSKGLPAIYWYGTKHGEVVGAILESEPFLKVAITSGFEDPLVIQTNLVGGFNIYNVLAACSVAKYFKIPAVKIKQALEQYEPSNSRSQLLEKEGNHIILDAYNANPSSMALAVENFGKMHAEKKILFLGAMKELGDETIAEHKALIELINEYQWKEVVLVGEEFEKIQHPYHYFKDADSASAWWKQQYGTGNYLLIKGSRSTKMEKIVG